MLTTRRYHRKYSSAALEVVYDVDAARLSRDDTDNDDHDDAEHVEVHKQPPFGSPHHP